MKIKKSKGAFRSIANRRFAFGWRKNGIIQLSFAKHHGGEFVLRIEDTDQSRFVAGAEEYIFDCLNWCGLTPTKALCMAVHMARTAKVNEKKAIENMQSNLLQMAPHTML